MDKPKPLAELFHTSKQNIGQHIASILKENELDEDHRHNFCMKGYGFFATRYMYSQG